MDKTQEIEQLKRIAEALNKIAERHHDTYTITGAADWEILLVVGIGFVSLIVYIWQSTISYIGKVETLLSDLRKEYNSELKEHTKANSGDFEKVESMIKDCQDDCCPPRMGRKTNGQA